LLLARERKSAAGSPRPPKFKCPAIVRMPSPAAVLSLDVRAPTLPAFDLLG
jgi:hypothetical protein